MEAIISLITLVGMGFAAVIGLKWMAKIGQINARKDCQLTPNDLKVLEESTARLMSDLKTVTNECVEKIEQACANAEHLLKSLEQVRQYDAGAVEVEPYTRIADIHIDNPDTQALPLCTELQDGMTNGELELLNGLMAMGK